MFWSSTPEAATVVDARQESRRIQENQALNKPVTDGRDADYSAQAEGAA